MRHVLRKTALVTTAAAAGVATLSTGASADVAVAKITKKVITCKSKQGDRGTLTIEKTSIGFHKMYYNLKIKGHGKKKRTANDIEIKDEGAIAGTYKYAKRNAVSVRGGKTYRWKKDLYGRSFGYVHVKFIFDIPNNDDHWCTAKKVI